jgi:hypothetical protein
MNRASKSRLAFVGVMCAVVLCPGDGCRGQTTPKTDSETTSEKVVVDIKKASAKDVQERSPAAGVATKKKGAASPSASGVDDRSNGRSREITPNNSSASSGGHTQQLPPNHGADDDAAENANAKEANEQAPYTEMVTRLADEDARKQPFYTWLNGSLKAGEGRPQLRLAVSAISDRELFFVLFIAGMTFVLLPISIAMFAAALGRKCASYRSFLVSATIGVALLIMGIVGPETCFKAAVNANPNALLVYAFVILFLGGVTWSLAGPVRDAKKASR